LSFNEVLVIMEYLEDIRLLFEEVNPHKFAIVINEAYIIGLFSY
jgi:hypothetical protein